VRNATDDQRDRTTARLGTEDLVAPVVRSPAVDPLPGVQLDTSNAARVLERRLDEIAQPLRAALIANLGRQLGDDAYAEALHYAWTHQEKLVEVERLVPYLFKVGRSRVWSRRRLEPLLAAAPVELPAYEPRLEEILLGLSDRQRTAVVLVVGWSWSYAEVADLLDVSKSTVQQHVQRGLAVLRRELAGGDDDG
jgi:RNA polymerase sigma factor (sigma-70 family)